MSGPFIERLEKDEYVKAVLYRWGQKLAIFERPGKTRGSLFSRPLEIGMYFQTLMFGLALLFFCVFLSFKHFDHLTWGRGSWSCTYRAFVC